MHLLNPCSLVLPPGHQWKGQALFDMWEESSRLLGTLWILGSGAAMFPHWLFQSHYWNLTGRFTAWRHLMLHLVSKLLKESINEHIATDCRLYRSWWIFFFMFWYKIYCAFSPHVDLCCLKSDGACIWIFTISRIAPDGIKFSEFEWLVATRGRSSSAGQVEEML